MSILPIAVLAGFALAIAAPFIAKAGRTAGALLSLLPLSLFIYFLSLVGPISRGDNVSVSYSWQPDLGLRLSFFVDGLSLLFALLITGIGFLILNYSAGYLGKHHHAGRFYAYLLMFMASMLGLVVADNVITLFIFWELTSLSSYFLIGFEHEKAAARSAARQALLVTGVGGLAMLAGMILMGLAAGTFELSELAGNAELLRSHALYVPILLLILGGAFTKSAQFPFYFWLPNAMEAPTPVSAYLHSATMVKAGIYVLARLSPTLGGTAMWESIVTTAGAITMVVGACMALVCTDLKRLLAYLTVSALGIMTMLLGIGSPDAVNACIVFLLAHAFYKGCLFMVAGAVDHQTGTRDLEKLGGLRRAMPMTALVAVIAAVSLAAFGPVLSFIGKEMVLGVVLDWEQGRFLLLPATVFVASIYVAGAVLAGFKPFFSNTGIEVHHREQISLWSGPLLLAIAGIVAGVFPHVVQGSIISPAAQAILGTSAEVKLVLWHGFNLPFLLSLVSVALGALLFLSWRQIRSRLVPVRWMARWGPQRWYEIAGDMVKVTARYQTAIFQGGHLRSYVLAIIGVAAALIAAPLLGEDAWRWPSGIADLRFWEAGLAALVVLAVGVTLYMSSRLAVIASLGVVGYGVALIYILFGAPDVSMTQFLVETLFLVLLVVAFFRLPRFAVFSRRWVRFRDLAVAVIFGSLMTLLVLSAIGTPHSSALSTFFRENSVAQAKGHNLVNVILVDFRALDTLGEITVLVTAAIGVFALLKLRPEKEAK